MRRGTYVNKNSHARAHTQKIFVASGMFKQMEGCGQLDSTVASSNGGRGGRERISGAPCHFALRKGSTCTSLDLVVGILCTYSIMTVYE